MRRSLFASVTAFSVLCSSHVHAAPSYSRQARTSQQFHARKLLGSSFGVPGNQTVDYLVIGGGTAGLALAERLAEQTGDLVAVVEAGGFYELTNGNITQIPAQDGYYVGKDLGDWQPGIDWGFATTPQEGSYGAVSHYARGKTLGGSSARNYMAYQRPSKGSLDMWADAVGDDSYRWDAFLPFYEKSVHFQLPSELRFANSTPDYDTSVMGNGSGPVSVGFANYAQAIASWTVKALREVGFKPIPSFQSGTLMGQSYGMYTINSTTGTRESSETSYLMRGLQYPNFLVFTETLGKRILFDANKRATGALLETQGWEFTIKARKEVVISCGAFQSPQLLMVSGVGPADTLKANGIPVVADRPGVGQNMQDHIIHAPSYRVNVLTQSAFQRAEFREEAVKEYNEHGGGMYGNPTSDVLAWEKVPEHLRQNFTARSLKALAQYSADWPEIEILSMGGYFGYQRNFVTEPPTDGYQYASLAWALNTPLSRGNISIKSADMRDHPLINPNWLTDPTDVAVSVAAFKRAREILEAEAMKPVLIGPEYFPGKQVATDEQIEDFIRKSFNTIFHASCTCAMGKADDPMAVLDSKAKVLGVEGLRVVDASSFPFLPPGHPQSTLYALGEKIACDMSGAC